MKTIVKTHKNDRQHGIYSVCSAHPLVIEAVLLFNRSLDTHVLIEATSNQVNQYGGYTGMRPADFRDFVFAIANKVKFPTSRIILGGDHLGPNCWQHESAEVAMQKAEVLIAQYVKAGFRKIHLDTSMSCADDSVPLAPDVVAERSARLCLVAENTATDSQKHALSYVIGTEVPIPGGEAHTIETALVTTVDNAKLTISRHQQAFQQLGLNDAFKRVIAIVVQPGVEFDQHNIIQYQRQKALDLSAFIDTTPFVYEAHSTDYQTPAHLKQLVHDHFAILKVGPALTFALREAVFALAMIEKVIIAPAQQSQIMAVMDDVMLDNPQYWQKYYDSKYSKYRVELDYSLSDRCRYYWPYPSINQALDKLLTNLSSTTIALGVLSQYMPIQFNHVLAKQCQHEPKSLLIDKIQDVLRQYDQACRSSTIHV